MPETGRTGAEGAPAGALRLGAGAEPSQLRSRALLLAAVLACLGTLAIAALPSAIGPASRSFAPHEERSGHGSVLSPELLASASSSVGASGRSYWPVRRGGSLVARGGGIDSTFARSGVSVRVAQGTLALRLAGLGRGRRVNPTAPASPVGAANEVDYRHGPVAERYRNGPYGLEQAFTVGTRPGAGAGPLVLALGLAGSLTPVAAGSQIVFRTQAGFVALRYGGLVAVDATGRQLPARMQLGNGGVELRIDDSHARYPVRIDPFFQQGAKLTGGEETAKGQFGASIALSSDGNTALVGGGGDNSNVGAAWVFVRSGSTWSQQGPKLTGTGEVGKGRFGGFGVALSADGNTALIGAGSDNGEVGAAWVFVRSGSTWEQQGSKLTGTGEAGKGHFGFRVALSGDGKYALIGAPVDNAGAGAAWVFVASGSTWEQQGSKLTGTGEAGGGEAGTGVALSADGSTALVGGSADNTGVGAAWVFVRSGSTWEQQGSKLTGTGEVGNGRFGFRVALSEDGNTALMGGGSDNGEVGAAWVFVRSGTTWEQQGSKLTGAGEVGRAHFGIGDSLSGDGNTALIGGLLDNGGVGAAWVFTRSGTTWEQQGSKLTGSGESGAGDFGGATALSADGSTAMVGGSTDSAEAGAAWPFASAAGPPPSVTSVTPTSGTTAGGTPVTIKGTGFVTGATVTIGSAATSVNVVSATEITAHTAATAAGSYPVVVSDVNGTSTGGPSYTYTPPPAPTVTSITPTSGTTAGGTLVTIKGTGFVAGATVTIGSAATSVIVVTSAKITAHTAATAAGSYKVVVTDANGTSTGGPSYTYVPPPPPTVTSVAPISGTTAGGTLVTIKGTGFVAGATVTIGNAATSVTVVTSAKITAKTAATAAGSDPVVVSDANGTSSGGPSYTYTTPLKPTVTSVSPTTGPVAGGTTVTIKGTNLTAAAPVVDFGATAATNIVSDSASTIVVTSPQAPAVGTVHVTVTTTGGTSATGTKDQFTYFSPGPPTVTSVSPSSGPTAGGTPVTIKGTGFLSGASVTIGSAATSVNVVSSTEITATTTATAAGSDAVVVTDANGTSTGGPSFTYVAPPTVTSIAPSSGPTAGGTLVTIKGSGFVTGATVTIGSEATEVFVVSETEIMARTAATAAGSDEVVVSDLNGTSSGGPSFTYLAPPALTSVSPTTGPSAGGTPVVINGSGFVAGATVTIGSEATEVVVVSETEITATTAATAAGPYEVVVTDANGTSSGGPSFTYEP